MAKRLPPKPLKFEANRLYEFKRGFASKVPGEVVKRKFDLDPKGQPLVWLAPDGLSLLSEKDAMRHNSRRRAALNSTDAWADLKELAPEKAKELGWNGFQKLVKGIRGSRVKVLERLQRIGIDVQTIDELAKASEGQAGENNGWGDSG